MPNGALERLPAAVRSRVGAFLAAALGLAALSGFVELSEELGKLAPLDRAILLAVAARRAPALTDVALDVTALGSPIVLALFTGLVALAFLRLGHARSAWVLVVAAAGAGILSAVLKSGFERARPDVVPRLTGALGFSYPSGHSLLSAAVYGSAAVLVTVQARRLADRILIAVVTAVVLGAIGASRVYLGVHYPSDVLGGYSAGLAWAFAVIAVAAFQRRARAERGEP